MKKHRLTALALCTMLVASAAGSCGTKKDKSEVGDTAQTVEMAVLELKQADIQLADNYEELFAVDKRGSEILLVGRESGDRYGGCFTSASFEERKDFPIDLREGEIIRTAAICARHTAAILTWFEEHTYLTLIKDDQVTDSFDLGELADDRGFVQMCADSSGYYIALDRERVVYVTADGVVSGDVSISSEQIQRISLDSDGAVWAMVCDGDAHGGDIHMYKLENGAVTEDFNSGSPGTGVYAMGTGCGDYRLVSQIGGTLYGLRGEQWVKINDFGDLAFNQQALWNVFMASENEFVVTIRREDTPGSRMYLLTERDISEIKERKIIKVGVNDFPGIAMTDDIVKQFNSEHDDYRVEFIYYTERAKDSDDIIADSAAAMKQDIATGRGPDIVRFDNYFSLNSISSRDSMFVDMYPYLDADPNISREDFIDGFLDLYATNGKLLQIENDFNMNCVAIRSSLAGDMTEVDFQKIGEIMDAHPEMNLTFDQEFRSRSEIFQSFIETDRFIDYSKATCNFDSPEFIEALRFFNDRKVGLTPQEWADFDGDKIGYDMITDLVGNKNALTSERGGGMYGLRELEQVFFGEPVTYIRSNALTNYGYGIMANSDVIDGAWEFLRFMLFEYKGDYFKDGWNKKVFEEEVQSYTERRIEIDPWTGAEQDRDVLYYGTPDGGTEELRFTPVTQETIDKYMAAFRQALDDPVYRPDIYIRKIVAEELDVCFAGEKSPEDTARIIQNRVEIYLSEHYS